MCAMVCGIFVVFFDKIESIGEAIVSRRETIKIASPMASILSKNTTK
jgi:hypothetical protein